MSTRIRLAVDDPDYSRAATESVATRIRAESTTVRALP